MEAMNLILFLVISVLLSAVLDRFIKNLTLPLVQIALGVLIALFAKSAIRIQFDSELFMVLFIAPLIYIEAKHASKMSLWKNLWQILGLSIGLVILTTITVGFTLNAIAPAVTIWAALALGAALGPTDAVAVTSVSKTTNIPERIFSVLKGELLLNDASGIVMFQVALAAVTTEAINVQTVATNFLLEFFGGLALGLLLGFATKFFLKAMREKGLDSTVFHVLSELCMPFLVYLICDSLHVSGIIAVVAAGLVDPIQNSPATPATSRMNIVSESVWDVLSFVLNGVVFVLLGTQIPSAFSYAWEDASISNHELLIFILVVTAILLLTRFIWCFVALKRRKKVFENEEISLTKQALIMTFAGAKGTITLSILFTMPTFLTTGVLFESRDMIIFIGCGVIVITLLLATFLLPVLAPKKVESKSEEEERENFYTCLQSVLREVIYQLTASETDLNRYATRQVIEDYQKRLDHAKTFTDDESENTIALRIKVANWQQAKTEELLQAGEVDEDVADEYLERLLHLKKLLRKGSKIIPSDETYAKGRSFYRRWRRRVLPIMHAKSKDDNLSKMRALRVQVERYAIERLKEEMSSANPDEGLNTENAAQLIVEYERNLSAITQATPTVTTAIRAVNATDDVRAFAYSVELNKINELQESGALSRISARKMRDNVELMKLELQGAI